MGEVFIVLTVAVGPFGGCADDPDAGVGGFDVSDSAGVVIVQSHRSAWNESNSGWVVESEPLLVIGKESGEEPYLFSGVVGAVRLSNGDIVVADRRSRELRYFDSEGRFRFSAGGQGQGPGELPTLYSLSRCSGDTLYAFDHRDRARLFDEAGEWLRTLPQIVTPAGGPPQALSCGSAGRFLIVGWDPGQMERIEGYYRIRPPVRLHDEEGGVLAEYGTFPSAEYVSFRGGAGPHTYSHRLVHALAEERVYIGTSDAYELRMFDLSGELERIVHWSGPDLTFTDSDFERYRDRRLTDIPADRRAEVEREVQEWIRPEKWPAYQALVIDPDGFLWVQAYDRTPADGTAPDWTVLTSEGRVLGGVSIPDGLEVTEIGTDYVLGVIEDSLGVERVALYRLIRKGGV